MANGSFTNDRVINCISGLVENCEALYNVDATGMVLFGSKARGDRTSQSDYEILILLDNAVKTNDFIKFTNHLRLELLKEKLLNVKILFYTPEVFEDVLYNDPVQGTFLYMLCKDNIVICEKYGVFTSIKERIGRNGLKDEEVFMEQCVQFSKLFGSEKWERKWEKTLMQFRYSKGRRGMD